MVRAPQLKLNNGVKIPQIGFGTWKMRWGHTAYKAVHWALEAGYRHIDTAHIYGNEAGVGRAIRDSGLKREEVFVTTKLFNTQHHNPQKAIDGSLAKLGVDYVDLYLMHWPVARVRNQTWQKMTEFLKTGKAKAIGVSNFTIRHLEELLNQTDVVPAVNQVEFHPFLYQKELLEYCEAKGVILEAYSPLTHGQELDNPLITKVAKKYKKSNAQIMIRWSLQLGNIVLPKSSHQERIKENIDVFDFEINDEDMEVIGYLNADLRTCWNPERIA